MTHILDGRVKELAEDVERERDLKDVAEAASKERAKVTTTAEKKATVSEKAKALAEKRLADLKAKVGETRLKLAEVESLKACESKWYNKGFADAENSVEPIINEAHKLAFKEGWFTALQAVGVPEDSPLKDLNQILLPSFLAAAQKNPIVA